MPDPMKLHGDPPVCMDCKYVRQLRTGKFWGPEKDLYCAHPKNNKGNYSPVRGRKNELTIAKDARSDSGSCGPSGKLFEPSKH